MVLVSTLEQLRVWSNVRGSNVGEREKRLTRAPMERAMSQLPGVNLRAW